MLCLRLIGLRRLVIAFLHGGRLLLRLLRQFLDELRLLRGYLFQHDGTEGGVQNLEQRLGLLAHRRVRVLQAAIDALDVAGEELPICLLNQLSLLLELAH